MWNEWNPLYSSNSLNIAAKYNSSNVAKLLVKYDPENTSLPMDCDITPIDNVVKYNSKETLEVLINSNIKFKSCRNWHKVKDPDTIASDISLVLTRANYGLTEERKIQGNFFRADEQCLWDYYFLFYFGYSDMLYLDTYIPFIENLIQRYDDMKRVLRDIYGNVYIISHKFEI